MDLPKPFVLPDVAPANRWAPVNKFIRFYKTKNTILKWYFLFLV